MASFKRTGIWALATSICVAWTTAATAYVANGHWTSTATDGPTGPIGTPLTLTWSIVPDGTTINQQFQQPSNLIGFLDGIFGSGPGGSNFALRPWFPLINSSYQRWSELGGMTFAYEPFDDGAINGVNQHSQGLWQGSLGVRGDLRLGGTNLDGPGGATAETNFIPDGDITFDTANASHFSNPGVNNNYVNLRNTLMHETGHSLGLGHLSSFNAEFLMEAASNSNFDGPQFDDIRGLQYLYGDAFEKGGGNNTLATAVELGTVTPATPIALGLDATTGTVVAPNEVDFVSVTRASDLDYFKFETDQPTKLDLVLTPVGPSYNEFQSPGGIVTIDTTRMSNLSLELYTETLGEPQLLASANVGGLGVAESLMDFQLSEPGSYFARISGSTDEVQFYTLEISVVALAPERPGDFNDDGEVDAADYTLWRDHFGEPDDAAILDRGDGIAGVGPGDYQVWSEKFGTTYELGAAAALSVPEPNAKASISLAVIALLMTIRLQNLR